MRGRRREKVKGRLKIFLLFLLTVSSISVQAQVKIRLFANQAPESAIFYVTEGIYELNIFNGETLKVVKDEPVIITKFDGKLAVKKRNSVGLICDSLIFTGKTGNDFFSLMPEGKLHIKQYYSGDLKCAPDFGTLLFINISDIEKYISGVVLAEGGAGKYPEYFKTQAIIARTYMYKYFDKHLDDKYNVCDNTHCQAFNGLSSDSVLNKAVLETKGLVILGKDSTLIVSTFHSNCGGETSSSDDVWLSDQPYLRSVVDPYCLSSRNATWQKSFAVGDWITYMRNSGFNGKADDPAIFNFPQKSRRSDYKAGSFTLALLKIRSDLNLRSTFFSVYAEGDSIILKGRGYGHGVGLCQEGSMAMAAKGFDYREIIRFYYSGVIITDIKNAVALP
jgi:stage II sporulation protein D